ncbi:hypothetical protein EK21DRAFT_82225, partial [Setomelanomma holmii]
RFVLEHIIQLNRVLADVKRASVTSIYAILRPVCLFGTLYLFGSSWLSGVGLDRDS